MNNLVQSKIMIGNKVQTFLNKSASKQKLKGSLIPVTEGFEYEWSIVELKYIEKYRDVL